MSGQLISWKRLWVPRGTFLTAFNASLNPLEWTGDLHTLAGGRPLEDLRSHHAVALLGEPGMGKTTTLQQSIPALEKHCAESGAELLVVDLRSHGSEERLERALFKNAKVERWKRGTHAIHLVLDSFDECHARLDTMGGLLADNLRELPRERLFLSVACRPAIWPSSLENALKELWPGDFLAMELAPLSRGDVLEAVRAYQVEPEAFLREVARLGVAELAVRPVTLKMLLGAFQRGALPKDRWQLYLDGCLQLARENNRSREESSRLHSKLDPEERLAIASRIAALTLLSNRDPIRLGPADEPPPHSIALDEMTGGEEEPHEGLSTPVDRANLREVLDSGLFRAIEGPRLLTWAHRTYEEFLAALFLHRRGIAPAQLQQLLCPPGDSRSGIIMQLQGLATWLLSQDSRFREYLLEWDPRMLLQSDALVLEPHLRAPLVRALLESVRRDPGIDESQLQPHFTKLAHEGLGAQLRGYLREPGGPAPVRGLALRIALTCLERTLVPECLELALEDTAPIPLRVQALEALRALGGDTPDARQMPLARVDAAVDPTGALRDRVLSWLWPGVLPTEQLFTALREPGENAPLEKTQQTIQERLTPEELPTALRWAREYLSRPTPHRSLVRLVDALFLKAFEHLDTPQVLESFCAAFWPKVKRALYVEEFSSLDDRHPLPWNWSQRTDEERWRVIDGLAAHREAPDDLPLLARLEPAILFKRDFDVLLRRAEQESLPEEQVRWARLIQGCYPWGKAEPLERIFQAIARAPHLASGFSWLLEATRLEERPPIFRVMTSMESEEYNAALWQHLTEPLESILLRYEQLLQLIEGGDIQAWFHLIPELQSSAGGALSILSSRLWRDLPGGMRERIVRAARFVVSNCAPGHEPWVESAHIPPWAVCIHEAFNFLAECDPAGLDTLPEESWRAWTTLIIASKASPSDERNRLRKLLVARAIQHAPVDVLRTFRRRLAVAVDWTQTGHAFDFLRSLADCWNETLTPVAFEVLRNPATDRLIVQGLLEILLDQQVPEARAFAESLLRGPDGDSRARRVTAASSLLLHAPASMGPEFWSLIQAEEDFAREVLEDCTVSSHSLAHRFEPELLADIYLWLERHGRVPPAPGKPRPWWTRTRPTQVHPLQEQILERLVQKFSRNTEAALARLCQEIPGDALLREKLFYVRLFVRAQTWVPPSPRELLELVGLQRRRFVRNEQELLDVLVESLQRLEEKLHGETPAIHFLWDEDAHGQFSPKDEVHLSNYVKHHLEEELTRSRIVVNREVELRHSMPLRRGERVDIWVDAITHQGGSENRISVPIEVKLSKNRELWTAMENQLVGRYLAENRLRYGLYLVGWYACAHWNDTTSYPGEGRVSLNRAKEILDAQARTLSRDGIEVRAFVLDAAFRTTPNPADPSAS